MFGKYTRPGPVTIAMKAKISGEEKKWTTSTTLPESDIDNPEIERLWALASIHELTDEIDDLGATRDREEAIINLGTEYSLVTDYTSMVVVSETEYEGLKIDRRNRDRIARERRAQRKKSQQPVKNYRFDKETDTAMFKGAPSPGIGSGPVGPFMLLVIVASTFIVRRKTS